MDYQKLLIKRYESELLKIDLLKQISLEFNSVPIDCLKLLITGNESLKVVGYKELALYQKLFELTGPVIYYYEIKNDSNKKVWEAFKTYKESKERNCSSVMKNYKDTATKILYVGSDRNSLARRTMEHLGYAHQHTGGLQISKWAPAINLQLKLNYCLLGAEYSDVIRHVEAVVAHNLMPLIGKREP
jgi:hypothetical protein